MNKTDRNKKYLIVEYYDVADEGTVGLIKVVTEKELKGVKSIQTAFGNIDGNLHPFNKEQAMEITPEEIKILKKFGLTDLEFGYCSLSEEEPEIEEEYN